MRIYPAHEQVVEPPPATNDNVPVSELSRQRAELQKLLDQDPDTPRFDGPLVFEK